MKKIYCVKCKKQRKFINPGKSYLKQQLFLLFVESEAVSIKEYLKKENQQQY